MTEKQERLYWREWGAVSRALKARGMTAAQIAAARHELHETALGFDMGHADFSNEETDKIFATFRSLSRPDDMAAQVAAIRAPRERLLWSVRSLAAPSYATAIARDRFDCADLENLTDAQLQQLKVTLIQRNRARRRKSKVGLAQNSEPF